MRVAEVQRFSLLPDTETGVFQDGQFCGESNAAEISKK